MPKVRIHKLIASAGLTSRRKAEEWILAGRVKVNGKVVQTLGVTVDPEKDEVRVGRTLVKAAPRRTFMLHKPSGCVTTLSDPGGRATVMDLLPRSYRHIGLRPVGRLDMDAEGLLLLTNDGDLSQRIAHPRSGCEKEYHVRVRGRPTDESLERLRKGIPIDGKRRAPSRMRVLRRGRDVTDIALVVGEGRNRQIKRMMIAIGHPVKRLRRTRIGRLQLGSLPRGAWRELREAKLRSCFPA